jgi:hypothetical protein
VLKPIRITKKKKDSYFLFSQQKRKGSPNSFLCTRTACVSLRYCSSYLFFRDETNTVHYNSNYGNAPVVTSFNHLGDTLTTKGDPPFALVSEVCVCVLFYSRKNFFFLCVLDDISKKMMRDNEWIVKEKKNAIC